MSTPVIATGDAGRPTPALGVADAKLSFAGAVKSEWLKLRTLRGNWLMIGLAVIAILGIGPIAILANNANNGGVGTANDLTQATLGGAVLAQLIVGVFGVLAATNEYANGLIRASLTANPRRWQTLAAKSLVTAVVVLIPGIVSCVITFLVSRSLADRPFYVAHLPSFSSPGVTRAVLFAGVYLTCIALVGQGLGWLVRNTAGAIASLVALLLIVPIILLAIPSNLTKHLANWLPGQAGDDMTTVGRGGVHPPALALAIITGYVAVSLGVGLLALTRRDA